jgi:hypothetical protein
MTAAVRRLVLTARLRPGTRERALELAGSIPRSSGRAASSSSADMGCAESREPCDDSSYARTRGSSIDDHELKERPCLP